MPMKCLERGLRKHLKEARRDDDALHGLRDGGNDDPELGENRNGVRDISHDVKHGMLAGACVTEQIVSLRNRGPQAHVRHIHAKAQHYSSQSALRNRLLWAAKVSRSICSTATTTKFKFKFKFKIFLFNCV